MKRMEINQGGYYRMISSKFRKNELEQLFLNKL